VKKNAKQSEEKKEHRADVWNYTHQERAKDALLPEHHVRVRVRGPRVEEIRGEEKTSIGRSSTRKMYDLRLPKGEETDRRRDRDTGDNKSFALRKGKLAANPIGLYEGEGADPSP